MGTLIDSELEAAGLRYDWTVEELRAIHDLPLTELLYRAQTEHRRFHEPGTVQCCTLLSIKTGHCPEDCSYCAQSARYDTGIETNSLMNLDEVLTAARKAKEHGATRFCMGAAWRDVPEGKQFDRVLDMVRGVRALGMEACCTLGMLTRDQAQRLADAGLTAYNHNVDTSPEYYDKIITTRTFQERLDTHEHIRAAGINLCCGGIIGIGESTTDRMRMLQVLANKAPHPESVPINLLARVPGTPLGETPELDPIEMVRMVATARISMPASMVRFAAGRRGLSQEIQVLCFMAGANSIFTGDKLLTTPNPGESHDAELFTRTGMKPMELKETAI